VTSAMYITATNPWRKASERRRATERRFRAKTPGKHNPIHYKADDRKRERKGDWKVREEVSMGLLEQGDL